MTVVEGRTLSSSRTAGSAKRGLRDAGPSGSLRHKPTVGFMRSVGLDPASSAG
ncbi:MAG: hypothetical protein PHW63_00725 [Alphaproteobacteria bacterium]|nr:hypothetical protein [Alphaproteobacteria bacterium]